ncbi:MAG: metallopeptidase family protein [Chloroflexi bacterium]|nr:metallopeptidase family protein [Chloroflexota bacterium]
MVRVSRQQFERLVFKALEDLPPSIRQRMDNVDVVLRDWPSRADLDQAGLSEPHELFGLYQGVPITERSQYDMALPDKITIFRRPLETACASRQELVQEVRTTVIHELAHHFGISDAELEQTDYR